MTPHAVIMIVMCIGTFVGVFISYKVGYSHGREDAYNEVDEALGDTRARVMEHL